MARNFGSCSAGLECRHIYDAKDLSDPPEQLECKLILMGVSPPISVCSRHLSRLLKIVNALPSVQCACDTFP